jgi:methyltransferase-like protein/cyclopropane fatty-acyl-phospholipid synthase-like methyltransferase
MSDPLLTSYEEVPYESKPIPGSHPDGLATMAILHGLEPPPVECCRVLELGCAAGGNLLPMALTLPEGRFVGIDLSPRQIADGQAMIDTLGVRNLVLQPLSILDVPDDLSTFDYILCHGVYSWVPREVQDKILAVCKRHLAPNGVAYVSYNTYPGWHLRGMVRDMLVYHARQFDDPATRVQQARAFLDFLVQALADSNTTYGKLIQEEADQLRPQTDSYFLHEELEAVNDPVYFHQFAERAAAHGLQYLSEARWSSFDANLPPELDEALKQMTSDLIEREQYLDFLRNRTFRRTLLCHADVPLNRNPTSDLVTRFQISSYTVPVSATPDVATLAVEQFRAADGQTVSTNNPLVKTALLCLAEIAPRAVPFEGLWEMVNARLEKEPETMLAPEQRDQRSLAEAMLQCFASNLVELHVHVPPLTVGVSERPVGSPLARLQCANNARVITNLWHRIVDLNVLDRLVLCHLDGRRDHAALLTLLEELAQKDILAVQHEGQPLRDPLRIRQKLSDSLGPCLRRLAGLALLVG